MAYDKTTEERLAEIEAKKKADKLARAKKKAASDKADAEYKKQEQTKERIAKENMQRASVDSAGNPQSEVGKNNQQDQQIEKANKTNLLAKYGQAYSKRESLINKYRKTGDPKDKQLALNAQSELEPIVAEYVKVFGSQPPGYKSETSLSKNAGRSEEQQRQGARNFPTAAETQSREVARSAGRNGTPSVAVSAIAQSQDPFVQSIIDSAAKNGLQLTLPQATAQADALGGGNQSLASTVRKTTQYTMQQVRAAADSIYQNSVGRVLNDDELRMLHQSLNNTLKASPTVTKTDASGNSVTTGGVDERGFMQQQAEANPEFASYQKATTYFDAMLGSLQGPVGGGI